jgi:uncharacterized protein YjbI with pentapeptide repeats
MANFYYNQNDLSWYSDATYITSADISTITTGDAVYGNGIYFQSLNLAGVNFTNATNCHFHDSDLQGAILPSSISGFTFEYSNLYQIDFTNVTMAGSVFRYYNANYSLPWSDSGATLPSNISGVTFINGYANNGAALYSFGDFANVTNISNVTFGDAYGTIDISPICYQSDGRYYLNQNITNFQGVNWDYLYFTNFSFFTGNQFIGFYGGLDGSKTQLDQNGSGYWDGVGALQFGQLSPAGYYINNQVTPLDSTGNGVYNGYYYSGGVQGSVEHSPNVGDQ